MRARSAVCHNTGGGVGLVSDWLKGNWFFGNLGRSPILRSSVVALRAMADRRVSEFRSPRRGRFILAQGEALGIGRVDDSRLKVCLIGRVGRFV